MERNTTQTNGTEGNETFYNFTCYALFPVTITVFEIIGKRGVNASEMHLEVYTVFPNLFNHKFNQF